MLELRRGDIVYVFLHGRVGFERNDDHYVNGRPALVIQNDGGNSRRSQTIVATLTGARAYKNKPTQVLVGKEELGAGGKDSVIDCGDILTIDRRRINECMGVWASLSPSTMRAVDAALQKSLALPRTS
ncbi:hypothetical protein Aph01nite_69340 [Acrocarpospora phusangensis]|uniref:mRNA interferase n=1 Tax=Acrocarpospora phusangensis TaxID=1070424 RepID=A0A919UP89_9ACTN|nr:hypothetical protein Aph01nite_69340 [Acrocarpospora phusangensis]